MNEQIVTGREVMNLFINNGHESLLVRTKEGEKLKIVSDFWGDHQQNWIVLYGRDGYEVTRYNMKFVEQFTWK